MNEMCENYLLIFWGIPLDLDDFTEYELINFLKDIYGKTKKEIANDLQSYKDDLYDSLQCSGDFCSIHPISKKDIGYCDNYHNLLCLNVLIYSYKYRKRYLDKTDQIESVKDKLINLSKKHRFYKNNIKLYTQVNTTFQNDTYKENYIKY